MVLRLIKEPLLMSISGTRAMRRKLISLLILM
nr:MAG TPA_asm: hypothetical protein [Caudoviricetes sp.]